MTLQGADVADFQGPHPAYPDGTEFVIIKASGGHGFRNPLLAQQVADARARGLIVGFYHYFGEPTSGGGDPAREAANFIEAVRPYVEVGTTFWLDVEEFPARVGYTGDLGDWLIAFCEAVERAFGCVCGIYCATWYLVPTGLGKDARLTKYPFWMASWQETVPAPQYMAPWDHLTLHQYNADGTDKDRFYGTREEFMALGVPAPTPPPASDPGTVRAYLNGAGQLIIEANMGGVAVEVEGVNIQDFGGSVKNAAGDIYDRSIKANVFEPWRKRGDAGATAHAVAVPKAVE